MSPHEIVREATEADVARIVAIWAEHLDFHAEFDSRFRRVDGSEAAFADHLRERIGKEEFLLLVAEVDGDVVGFLNAEVGNYPPCFVSRAHGIIEDLAVAPPWQRRGLGMALVRRGLAWFRDLGLQAVEARVLMANPRAMGFWAEAGFEPYMLTFRTFAST